MALEIELEKGRNILVVPSNHTDHLTDLIDRFEFKHDLENAKSMMALTFSYMRATESGIPFNAFVNCMSTKTERTSQLILPYRDESYTVKGIELGTHGDKGPNGARGNRKNLDKIGVNSIIGHSHSPGIYGGTWRTGTSSKLRITTAARAAGCTLTA